MEAGVIKELFIN